MCKCRFRLVRSAGGPASELNIAVGASTFAPVSVLQHALACVAHPEQRMPSLHLHILVSLESCSQMSLAANDLKAFSFVSARVQHLRTTASRAAGGRAAALPRAVAPERMHHCQKKRCSCAAHCAPAHFVTTAAQPCSDVRWCQLATPSNAGGPMLKPD